jgi:hypothetical protein
VTCTKINGAGDFKKQPTLNPKIILGRGIVKC